MEYAHTSFFTTEAAEELADHLAASAPALTLDDWEKVAPGLESYLADHMSLRPWIVTGAHRIHYAMGAPVTHDVVIGRSPQRRSMPSSPS